MSVEPYETAKGTRWRVRYTTPQGKRTDKRGFRTKAAAKKFEAEAILGILPEKKRPKTEPPLKTYVDQYLLSINHLSQGTQIAYKSALHTQVLPQWGDTTASEVTKQAVITWVATSDLSRISKTRCLHILRNLLIIAVNNDPHWLDPTLNIPLPSQGHIPRPYLLPEQVELFANASDYPAVIWTLASTGIRWGELWGLEVRHIDFDTCMLTIEQSVSLRPGGVFVVGPTKTRKRRKVAAPLFVCRMLTEWVEGKSLRTPVFTLPNGDRIQRPRSYCGWWCRSKQAVAAVDPTFPADLRPHDLRHTAASLMVRSGAHVKVVQRQLGHASATMTLDIYADLFDEDLSVLTHNMGAMFGRGQNVGKS